APWPSRRLIWNFTGDISVTDHPNDEDPTLSYTQIAIGAGGGGAGLGPTLTVTDTGTINNQPSTDDGENVGAIAFTGSGAVTLTGIAGGADRRWIVLHAIGGAL